MCDYMRLLRFALRQSQDIDRNDEMRTDMFVRKKILIED